MKAAIRLKKQAELDRFDARLLVVWKVRISTDQRKPAIVADPFMAAE
jgi:hypothetical protein